MLFLPALLLFTLQSGAQETKPAITTDDYKGWQNLGSYNISDDGKWVSWSVRLTDMDDSLYIENLSTGKRYSYPNTTNLSFSPDSRWVSMRIGFPEKEIEKMREQKKPIRYKERLLNLESGSERIFDNIESSTFSRDGSHLVLSGYAGESRTRNIYLCHLKSGRVRNIGNIAEFSINHKGDRMAYIVSAEDKKGNGVELLNLTDYSLTFLDNDTAIYRSLVWEREGDALAFMKELNDTIHTEANYQLFAVRDIYGRQEIKRLDPIVNGVIPADMKISENYRPSWSSDMKKLFFGVSEWTPKPPSGNKNKDKADPLPGVDIWHWLDDPVQPRQQSTYNSDRNFTYLFTWNIDPDKVVRITDDELTRASVTGDGKHAVARNTTLYRPAFREELYDFYIVSTETGDRKLFLEEFTSVSGSSPDGRFVLYFRDGNWWVYEIAKEKHINITGDIPTTFSDTRYDGPRDVAPPFGTAGWLKDDKAILAYDDFDVWQVPVDGSGPIRLTKGKEENIRYRLTRLDRREPFIDPADDLYFSMSGDIDKKSGYYKIPARGREGILIYDDKSIGGLSKAEKSDLFLFRSETYSESPNIFTADASFRNIKKVSETNPQQADYAWGHSEIVHFKNVHGQDLQGALFYPANYEPGKKYPMIVYIYEIRSNQLNRYVSPSERSAYNTTNYTSQGYFVYQPDIVYRTNHPGNSAVECVIPAVEEVLKTGMIDEKRVGLMGHSWGAYQTSFIITQTDMFAAAVAGAPLINMISMYNTIYWNSGTPNQNIFETGQGRLREPWWDIMDEYKDNSPMFQAQNINTPLLVAFGTEDGAVDFGQGVEMFTTMRRMGKPYIMLVYEGENHSLRRKENQLDYTKKVNEYFNHLLKDEEPAEWILKGRTYLEKRKEEDSRK